MTKALGLVNNVSTGKSFFFFFVPWASNEQTVQDWYIPTREIKIVADSVHLLLCRDPNVTSAQFKLFDLNKLTHQDRVVQGSLNCHIPMQLVSLMQCEVPGKSTELDQ